MNALDEIKTSEARAIMRLTSRLHDVADPIARKRELLDGLCEMVDALSGCCRVIHHDARTAKATVVSDIGYCSPAGLALLGLTDEDANPTGHQSKLLTFLQQGPALESTLNLSGSIVSATICLFRHPSSDRQFTGRDRTFIDMIHSEMTWIYHMDLLLTSPSSLLLSPRARQTLGLLLGGLSEKQIASRLRLSPNTVHHYVKCLHKHFNVSSRSELLARWVGR